MEWHKRTHLVNALMEEAGLMMKVLQKAMEATQAEADHKEENPHIPDEAPHPPSAYTIEEEYAAWERVCTALHAVQAELEQIEHAEQARIERLTPSV